MSGGLDTDTQLAAQQLDHLLHDFFNKFNLFSWLGVGPLGVPSLNAGSDASAKLATGAAPQIWQVADFNTYVLLLFVLSVAGLLIAGLFWAMLSGHVRQVAFSASGWLRSGIAIWVKLLILTGVLILAFVILIVPISFVAVLISALSVGLASLVPALGLSLMLWGVFYLVFTVHGVALYQMTVRQAMRLSSLIARVYFAATLGLVTLSLAIYIGIGLIWDSFAIDSWLRLAAIIGNAFVVTSLLIASLVYYQNRSTILLEFFQAAQPAGS